MADITTTRRFRCDLDRGVCEAALPSPLMHQDAHADTFSVSVRRGMSPIALEGMSAQGYVYLQSTKQTLPLTGSVSGSTASVTLTDACYAVPGPFSLVVQVCSGDVRHTLLHVTGQITRTCSDAVYDPDGVLPSLPELLAQISSLHAIIETAQSAADYAFAAADASIRTDVAQDLTDAQRAQARENAAAAAAADLGSLDELLTADKSSLVTALNEAMPRITDTGETHVFLEASDVDATLSVPGKAADAAEVGRRLAGAGSLSGGAAPIITSVQGDPASIYDAAEADALEISSRIEPLQLGSGDPSPANVRPFVAWGGADLTRLGANIFGGSALLERVRAVLPSAIIDEEAGTIRYTGSVMKNVTFFSDFKPNTRYTIVLRAAPNSTSSTANMRVTYTNGDFEITSINARTKLALIQTAAGKTVKAMIGYNYSGTTTLLYHQCGVFEGLLSEEDFLPYAELRLTAATEQVYGGSYCWTSGLLTIDHVMENSFTITASGTADNGVPYAEVTLQDAPTNTASILCSKYLLSTESPAASGYFCPSGSVMRIFDSAIDPAAPESILEGLAFCYATAPRTVQLAPAAVPLHKGCNTLRSSTGAVTATYTADTRLYIDHRIALIESRL